MDLIKFYIDLGFWHVLHLEGLDHFFFIVTLVIPFGLKDFKKLIIWTTLFTIGHTLSLVGNFYAKIYFSSYWIEILIPVTIALSALSLLFKKKNSLSSNDFFPALITFVFGVIHGLGFGRYFSMLVSDDEVSLSLFSFALGVEFSQIVIVFLTLVVTALVTYLFKNSRKNWEFLIGAMVLSKSLSMIFERI